MEADVERLRPSPRDLIHARVSQWPKVQILIMNSRNRAILMAGLALLASTCLSAPSSAQKGETAALSAKITEPSRAGKYSEALPLAQGQLQTLEQKFGPAHRDVAVR
jgi:hypothetical protein